MDRWKRQKLEKSENHKVKYGFYGKSHFFEVDSESGDSYNVVVKVNCDCRYQSVQGTPNGKVCSHIIAVLKDIVARGDLNE